MENGVLIAAFAAQVGLGIAAFAAAPWVAGRAKPVWATVLAVSFGLLLLWPLMRVFPVAPIELLGAPFVACVELTGLAIPAVLLFGIASRHLPKRSDRRAILMLTAVAAIYFVKAGWWMVSPGVPSLRATHIDGDGVCRQSTSYTCVAASMVTVLRARGIAADELEMARLAYTQVGGGATDSRALWAFDRKLVGTGLTAVYRVMDAGEVVAAAADGPFMVQLDWGYFVSHMVPVLAATAETVTIGDPLSGRREMPMAEFLRKWKGTGIVLEARE